MQMWNYQYTIQKRVDPQLDDPTQFFNRHIEIESRLDCLTQHRRVKAG